jgi:DNA-binding protein HU-beta
VSDRLEGPAFPRKEKPVLAAIGLTPTAPLDETRNYGETDRELLLRPEAEVVLGRDVRGCWPTARFVRFQQPEAAEPSPRTHRSAPRHGERNSGAPIAVAQPSAYARPGPSRALRRRSTWLLLSPRGRSDVEHSRSREKRQRAASRTTRLHWNDRSRHAMATSDSCFAAEGKALCGRSVLCTAWANAGFLHPASQPCLRRQARPSGRRRTTRFTIVLTDSGALPLRRAGPYGRLVPACPIAEEQAPRHAVKWASIRFTWGIRGDLDEVEVQRAGLRPANTVQFAVTARSNWRNPLPLTQTQLVAAVAERADMSRGDAKRALGALDEVVLEELGNAQKVRIGGLVQLTVRVKPAQKKRQGRNPATAEEIEIAAKPASVDLRARPLAKAKAALPSVQKARRRLAA